MEQFYTCVLSILALNGREADGDLVLIGPQCLSSVNYVLKVSIKTWSLPASFSLKGYYLLRCCNLYYLTLIFLGIQEVCEAERALGIMWTKTGAGHYSTHPCPREAKGRGDPRGRPLRRTRGQGHNEETKHLGGTLKYLGEAFLGAFEPLPRLGLIKAQN